MTKLQLPTNSKEDRILQYNIIIIQYYNKLYNMILKRKENHLQKSI